MFDDDALIGLSAVLTLVLAVQFLRRPDLKAAGARGEWLAACGAVLAICGALYVWRPAGAGTVAVMLMILVLVVPGLIARTLELTMRGGRYRRAFAGFLAIAVLHPVPSAWRTLRLVRALLPLQRNDLGAAVLRLRRLLDRSRRQTAERAAAAAYLGWLTRDWPALAAMPPGPATDAARIRGLGEMGERDDMLATLAAAAGGLGGLPGALRLSLVPLALCGRPRAVAALLAGPLIELPADYRRFWLATAQLAAGERAAALPVLRRVAETAPQPELREAARFRLDWAPPARPLGPHAAGVLATMEALAETALPAAGGVAIVTKVLMAANIAAFAAETLAGGSTDSDVLYRLGGLWPQAVVEGGEPWRLVSALFLHAGFAHIAFNMLALAVFGPPIERRVGAWRFAVLYLGAGLGSMLAVTALAEWGAMAPDLLVGASGAIMGLIGGIAGLLLRLRGRASNIGGLGLRQVVTLVVLQSMIDVVVPHISMAGHLSGVAAGFLIGYALPPRIDRAARRA